MALSFLSVIIPARDEEGCIASTVEQLHLELELRGVPHEIIAVAVDDGSTDRTWIWTRTTPDWEKERSLKAASYLITTSPQRNAGILEFLRQRFKGAPNSPPESVAYLYQDNIIAKVYEANSYAIFELGRIQPGSP
jgi:hypothetical protein